MNERTNEQKYDLIKVSFLKRRAVAVKMTKKVFSA